MAWTPTGVHSRHHRKYIAAVGGGCHTTLEVCLGIRFSMALEFVRKVTGKLYTIT